MKKYLKNFRKITAIFLSSILAVLCCFIPTAATATATDYSLLSNFVIRTNAPSKMPTESDNGIVTSSGILKMQALDEPITYTEKEFTDLYNIDNYDIYGNKYNTTNYTVATYGATFDSENGIITTADSRTKLKIEGSEGMTDFETEFTITKLGTTNSLYGGISFRLQDNDYRTDTFGTQGYMLFVNSAADSCDVKILLRKYSTATTSEEDSETATALLGTATNGVNVKVVVSGQTVTVTVADAENEDSTYSTEFTLIPDETTTDAAGTYYDSGSIAYVFNGNHTIEDLSLKGSVPTNYVTHQKELFNLYNENYYTVYGNTTGDDVVNYGVTFAEDKISTYGQSKIKINGDANVEDFKATFDLKKTNGNALYGGIAFHIQDVFFEKATFGTPGYLLYAYSTKDSMDLSLILRNYSTASGRAEKQVTFEGFLAAADQKNIRMEVEVIGSTMNVTVYDLTDLTRKDTAVFDLTSDYTTTPERAGNFKGGSIAFVSNGTHDYSNISVAKLVSDAPYTVVENFEAQSSFTIPSSATYQFGFMFNVQDIQNRSPGLTGFAFNCGHTSSTADNAVILQLVRYGTNSNGSKNVNLGGMSGSTKTISGILSSSEGNGDKLQLNLKVVRGTVYYSVLNLTTNKESDVYSLLLDTSSTSSSVTYTTKYSSGGIGYFTNTTGAILSDLKITKLADCIISIDENEGGTTTGADTYAYSENVTVVATPDYGYYFGGWYNGDELVSDSEEYTFTATESLTLTPVFVPFPLKFNGTDTQNIAAVINLDSIDNVSEVGFEVTVKSENDEISKSVSSRYINADSANKTPWIATSSKVYYCDITGDGAADALDLTALRKGLIGKTTLTDATADLNCDEKISLKDLVCFKKAAADSKLEFNSLDEGYNYPFVIGDLLNTEGKQYIELKPYSVTNDKKTYGAPRYLSYDGTALTNSSVSENHTPFGKIRIACVGDSLTQGVGATGWASGDYTYAYPEQLGVILENENCIVQNFGVGGSYTWYYEGRNESLWYPNTAKYQPSIDFDADIVIMMHGTNDARCVTNEEDAAKFGASFEEFLNRWLTLEHKPIMYVCNGTSMAKWDEMKLAADESWVTRDDKFRTYVHPQQQAVAEKLGLEFIDTYYGTKEVIESVGLASDMLHPNDTGYRAMAELIAENISLDIYY